VLKHRADVTYQITFEPVYGHRLLQLREFLDSTEGGEPFTMDLYGNSSRQISVKRIDDGYDESPFIRRGAEDLDMFTATIQVLVL
jgi:hypothetical protein